MNKNELNKNKMQELSDFKTFPFTQVKPIIQQIKMNISLYFIRKNFF